MLTAGFIDLSGFSSWTLAYAEWWWASLIWLGFALTLDVLVQRWQPRWRHRVIFACLLCLPLLPVWLSLTRPLQPFVSMEQTSRLATWVLDPLPPLTPDDLPFQPDSIGAIEELSRLRDPSAPPRFALKPWLALTMGFSVLMGLGFFARGAWQVYRWKHNAVPVTDDSIRSMLKSESTRLGFRQSPQLLVSPDLPVPLAMGIWQRCILLPKELLTSLSESDQRQILRHELTHLQNLDPSSLLLSGLLRALMVTQPLIWLFHRRLALVAELAADQNAYQTLDEGVAYTRLLVRLAENMRPWSGNSYATGALNQKSVFLQRSEFVLHALGRDQATSRFAPIGVSLIGVAALSAVTTLQIAPRIESGIFVGNTTTPVEHVVWPYDGSGFIPATIDLPVKYAINDETHTLVSETLGITLPITVVDWGGRYDLPAEAPQKTTFFIVQGATNRMLTLSLCRTPGPYPAGEWTLHAVHPSLSGAVPVVPDSGEELAIQRLLWSWIEQRMSPSEQLTFYMNEGRWPTEISDELTARGIGEALSTFQEARDGKFH